MFHFSRPDRPTIQRFLESQSCLDLTYSGIGGTRETPPAKYVVDRTTGQLGAGELVFQSAQAALREWKHFQLGWVEPCWPDTAIVPNQTVAILARACGLWMLNACRIIYVVEEPRRFGFAYGTLPGHVETGEERFTVEWNSVDDSVVYDILAFSRPNHFLTRIAYPLTRVMQRRFSRDSVSAMKRAVVN